SPFLFSLYTSDCRCSQTSCHLQTFSDDCALVGLISDGNDQSCRYEADRFVTWCEANYLNLNIGKTKELVIDPQKKKNVASPVLIKNQTVEIVSSYNYLGVHIDSKLNWSQNVNAVLKKGTVYILCPQEDEVI
ncbi:hypothetical protein LDENG_00116440, partial [Lucifuga dentata]